MSTEQTESNLNNSSYFNIAKDLALQAGQTALELQNQLDLNEKAPKDLVTNADFKCDQIIRDGINNAFPSHCLITEENENINEDSPYRWHVDPIDGTVNYANKIPLWGVSIGLEHQGEMQVGIIFLPALNEFYYAIKGEGAFCNGLPIKVNNVSDISNSIMTINGINIGKSSDEQHEHNNNWLNVHKNFAGKIGRMRSFGAAVYEGICVATGSSAFYLNLAYNSWDIAAVLLLVEEAGGMVTNFAGEKLDLMDDSKGAIFSNKLVHEQTIAILNP